LRNACAERLIGSIRRECLDHVVVFGERHLRHVLLSYMNYYNETRTHLSLDKDAPLSRTVQRAGVFFAFQSWAGCITNIFGFDLRQAQLSPWNVKRRLALSTGAGSVISAMPELDAARYDRLRPEKMLYA
jgi:hypothetical protein